MSRSLGILPFLFACTGEHVIDKRENTAPIVLLVSHSDGAEIQEGYTESFRATVSDDDNEFNELQLAWYVGEELVCDWTEATSAGESVCDIVFSPEDTNVIVEVRDQQGAGGRAEINVLIIPTEAPVISLLSPERNGRYYVNELVQFSAVISDQEDATEDLRISWSSNQDGALSLNTTPNSENEISDYVYLSQGEHAIELQVEDLSGKIATEEVVIVVNEENAAPTCQITEPEDRAGRNLGDTIFFLGTAADVNIPPTDLTARWSSSIDGYLGEGSINSSGEVSFTYSDLSADSHVITLQIEDDVGSLCEDTIILTVGYAPEVSIDAPLNDSLFQRGEQIFFQGTVNDVEDSSNELTVAWSSSRDGEIMVGMANSQGISQFSSAALTPGTHSLSLSATDSTGLVGDAIITFHVNTPPEEPEIIITPDPVYSDSALMATGTNAFDEDGDTVSYSYEWYEGTTLMHSTSTVPSADLDVGDIWTVRVTPNDGYHDGAFAEETIVVVNTPPSLSAPSIISSHGSAIYNDSIVTCTATPTDPDETIQETYQWLINGISYAGASVDLSSLSLLPGAAISCTASAVDSDGASTTETTQDIISNRNPVVSGVSISPGAGVLSDSLVTCSYTALDDDESTLSPAVLWQVSGATIGTTTALQLTQAIITPGDTLECIVSLTDNLGASASGAAQVSIQNSLPVIDSVQISPSAPDTEDTLVCSASVSDIDAGTPSLSFTLSNQTTGAVYTPIIGTNSVSLDLNTVTVSPNDQLQCSLDVTDPHGGTASDQLTVTIGLPAPDFTVLPSVSPSTGVVTGSSLSCSAAALDPDGSVSTMTYQWQVNGSTVFTDPITPFTVDPLLTNVGDTITCVAVATDSLGRTSSSTSSPILVENTAPVISSATLSTLTPATSDPLTVTVQASDADVESLSYSYEWYLIDASANGFSSVVHTSTGSSSATLASSYYEAGDQVYAVVTVTDSQLDTAVLSSASATVQDSPPTDPVVSLSSSPLFPPTAGEDDLICAVDTPSTDPDGQPISYTYSWYDSTFALKRTITTSALQDTYPSTGVYLGIWTCAVEASSGSLYSNTAEATIAVIGRESCKELYDSGFTTNGMYTLEHDNNLSFDVYCDMQTDEGGWTLVGSSLGDTLNDQSSAWYIDLASAFPSTLNAGVWDGLRGETEGDIRFTCTIGADQVDLSFYNNSWYDEITAGSETSSCFNEGNGAGQLEMPARKNNLTQETRAQGVQWSSGLFEGEDNCSSSDDFTVDFDDRGMDGDPADGTDWGEDDNIRKCGTTSGTGLWQIWVR